MAIIVSSIIASQVTQKDGRIAVVEIHTDLIGLTHDHLYLAAATDNLTTNLNNWAAVLSTTLPEGEINGNVAAVDLVGASAVITTYYSAFNDTVNAVLTAFAGYIGITCLNASMWLNTLSFAQLSQANPTKFPNVIAFNNWKSSFISPAVNANTTVNSLVGG